jgi:hypothetical protein
MRKPILLAISLSIFGCGAMHKGSTSGGGSSSAALAGTMAEAKMYNHNSNIASPLGCNTAGYAKVNAKEGEAYKIDFAVAGAPGACMHVRYLNGAGGDGGGTSFEICTDKEASKTMDVTGQSGGSFIEVMENPPCKNATTTIAVH